MRLNYLYSKWSCLILTVTAIALLLQTNCAWADLTGPSLGDMSQSILSPVSAMANLLSKFFYIIGTALVLASGIQYKAHRDNPSQVPINRPIFMLVIGLVLVAVPIIGQLSSASTAVS